MTIVVGDIHGKVEVVEAALKLDTPTIFVGDFLDDYTRTSVECVASLEMALSAAERRSDVTVLLGNHELSYLVPHMRCSGWDAATQAKVNGGLGERMHRVMKRWHWEGDVLISHAGLTRDWFPKGQPVNKEDVERVLDELSLDQQQQIGYRRGGWRKYGGIFWCDISEFVPTDNVFQVFGHSRGEYQITPRFACIDCLDYVNMVLDLEKREWGTI